VRTLLPLLLALLGLASSGCLPRQQEAGPPFAEPIFSRGRIVTGDDHRLPVERWAPAGRPRAVMVALHGFNDYRQAFAAAAAWWAERGLLVYAYDQRGFGETVEVGIWGGTDNMVGDLVDVVRAVRRRHPDPPIVLLGSSMGGAVILTALGAAETGPASPRDFLEREVAGAVLLAPAIWGRKVLPPGYAEALWFATHLAPWRRYSGSGLGIKPSDNVEMLRALGRDPLIIKESRSDAVWGLVELMDAALQAAPRVEKPLLVLYGERDEVIPENATRLMMARLSAGRRLVIYPKGYHMLLRDLQAETVWRDVLAWIEDSGAALPSGFERPPEVAEIGAK